MEKERPGGLTRQQRHYYDQLYDAAKPFGSMAVRHFYPEVMSSAHWHGHIEGNYLCGNSMSYRFDDREFNVPGHHLVLFWAGRPHQTTEIKGDHMAAPTLYNLYVPFDAFLMMDGISDVQWHLLNGAVLCVPARLVSAQTMDQWLDDFASENPARAQLVLQEVQTILHRIHVCGANYVLSAESEYEEHGETMRRNVSKAVAMIRFALANLEEPITAVDVAKASGLHVNYAQALFAKVIGVPIKQFLLRVRLLRAQNLLHGHTHSVEEVAFQCGFGSMSTFYDRFKREFQRSPAEYRKHWQSRRFSDSDVGRTESRNLI